MSLPHSAPRRARHRRAIDVQAFEHEDGLWDIEACLTDRKARDTQLATGVGPSGLPIHERWLRVTIDRQMNVVDAQSSSEWVPYPGHCEGANPSYRALIGLNLRRGGRRAAMQCLGGAAGCTHLTELCAVLPSAAIQAFVGEAPLQVGVSGSDASGDVMPFQLGRCHALKLDAPVMKPFYPRWQGHGLREARAAAREAAPEVAHSDIHSNSQTEGNHA